MSNHRRLKVWHRAAALSLAVHRAARPFRPGVAPGLKSQLLRAVASIPANIAEGAGQQSAAQFAHFISIAIGSVNETECHLELARGLGLLPDGDATAMLDELDQIRRMLLGLRKHLTSGGPKP